MASRITSSRVFRASLAWFSASPNTEAGTPSSLVSSCSAVMKSRVPATLKSHVAVCVLCAEDVGQRHIAGLTIHRVGNQTHGDSGNRLPQRHASVEQRQR